MTLKIEAGQEFALDYFAGGVPTYAIFAMHIESIQKLLTADVRHFDSTIEELAFIGVVSYTEAFFKDHFASILNILPNKVSALKKGDRDVHVDLTDLLELEDPLHSKFGFLLSERFNFGNPKSVNALYRDLLLIAPFSNENAVEFDRIIATRNLLVHHGGMLTSQFNKSLPAESRERVYFDSVRVTKATVCDAAILAVTIASKLVKATEEKLTSELSGISSEDTRNKAVQMMAYECDEFDALITSLRSISGLQKAPSNFICLLKFHFRVRRHPRNRAPPRTDPRPPTKSFVQAWWLTTELQLSLEATAATE